MSKSVEFHDVQDSDFVGSDDLRALLVRNVLGDDSTEKQPEVLKLKPTAQERRFLDKMFESSFAPSRKALVFDALYEYERMKTFAELSLGSYTTLGFIISEHAKERELLELKVSRLHDLFLASQKGFQLFSVLHDLKYGRKVGGA